MPQPQLIRLCSVSYVISASLRRPHLGCPPCGGRASACPTAASRAHANVMDPAPPGRWDPAGCLGRGESTLADSPSGLPIGLREGDQVRFRVRSFANPEHRHARSWSPQVCAGASGAAPRGKGECGASAQAVQTGRRKRDLTWSREGRGWMRL